MAPREVPVMLCTCGEMLWRAYSTGRGGGSLESVHSLLKNRYTALSVSGPDFWS